MAAATTRAVPSGARVAAAPAHRQAPGLDAPTAASIAKDAAQQQQQQQQQQVLEWASRMGFPPDDAATAQLDALFKGPQLTPVWQFLVTRVRSKTEAESVRRALEYVRCTSDVRSSAAFLQYRQDRIDELARVSALREQRDRLRARHDAARAAVARLSADRDRAAAGLAAADAAQADVAARLAEERRRALVVEAVTAEAEDVAAVARGYKAIVDSVLGSDGGSFGARTIDRDIQESGRSTLTKDVAAVLDCVETDLAVHKSELSEDTKDRIKHLNRRYPRVDILRALAKATRDSTAALAGSMNTGGESLAAAVETSSPPPPTPTSKGWTARLAPSPPPDGGEPAQAAVLAAARAHVARAGEADELRSRADGARTAVQRALGALADRLGRNSDLLQQAAGAADAAGHRAAEAAVRRYADAAEARLLHLKSESADLVEWRNRIADADRDLAGVVTEVQELIAANDSAKDDIETKVTRNRERANSGVVARRDAAVAAATGVVGRLAHTLDAVRAMSLDVEDLVADNNADDEQFEALLVALRAPLGLPPHK
ncbi:hypothetical protein HK405_007571, partial [Cladochytrium tenue]